MKVKVAVLQYDVPLETEDSFKKLEEILSKAEWMGAKLVVVPETVIGSLDEVKTSDIDYLPRLSELIKKYGVYFVTSFYHKENKKIYNQGYILNPQGEVILEHKKLYPAKPEKDDGVEIGKTVSIVDTEIGKIGMLICKDGFNKYSHYLYEKFSELGVDIICIPTWSLTWKELDTQEYIKHLFIYGSFLSRAFILMSGNLNRSTNSFGRSLIVSPINGILKEGSTDKKEILFEDLDLDEVKKSREFDSWWQPEKRTF
jgi:predicted amidohydrolase